MSKVSLANRKRLGELTVEQTQADVKKEELLTLKMSQLNAQAERMGTLLNIAIHDIQPDPNQPRKSFRNIDSLAQSIESKGIIQPIIVTEKTSEGFYYIIAGERRFRAAKQIGLSHIPCIVRNETDADILIIQLLENDQREKVSPFEEADALVELIKNKKLKKGVVAKSLGHDNSWVSMRMKLAESADSLRALSEGGLIDDARTLYELKKFEDEMPEAAKEFIEKIHAKKIRGSYRAAIKRARDNWRKREESDEIFVRQGSDEVLDIYFDEDLLVMKLENKAKPLKLQLSAHNLTKLYRELQARVK
ncbi:ParB/RepB/Spo0J family partition protein [Francisellaceae bacterium]|nr:ParB/RepB/Spo0J family partition protein [Francisellaceae bacterium]